MNIRRVHNNELQMAVELAEQVFCATGERYMEHSFPTLFRPGISHSYGAFTEEGQLVSFMGLVPVQVSSGKHILSAFSIGAVCTHPDYRGQRLAGQLLAQCTQHAIDAGASLLFISGDRSLYTRAGSQFFGHIHQTTISHDVSSQWQSSNLWDIRPMKAQDIFAVHALLQRPSAHINMSLSEMQLMIHAEAMAHVNRQQQHILVAATPNGIAAFVVLSIPMDTPNAVNSSDSTDAAIPPHPALSTTEQSSTSAAAHTNEPRRGSVIEWAGRPDAVRELWGEAICRFQLDSLSATIPWQEQQMLTTAQEAGVTVSAVRNGGTMMIINSEALLAQTGLLHGLAENNDLQITNNPDNSYTLETPQNTYVIQDDQELCSLLFNPYTEVLSQHLTGFPTVALPYMYGLYFI
ncbi:GNAT family N-acetyltransferase [Paenibacillus kandeliae]|uniref:GNAT family N-acetyltransferase n=1 Tax=Paenibacillus kandeliae TaxID=3231269 RepID=UPI00345979BD